MDDFWFEFALAFVGSQGFVGREGSVQTGEKTGRGKRALKVSPISEEYQGGAKMLDLPERSDDALPS